MKYQCPEMRMKNRILTSILSLCFSVLLANYSFGESGIIPDTSDYYRTDYLRNDNYVYQNNIKSVELSRIGFELADPVITLNSDERFHVAFDDLQRDFIQYYYRIQHCTDD